jgi:organic radical activating enzyme
VLEVFSSIQGEGLHAGEPQVFVRLAGCPLRCRYCDTPGSWELPGGADQEGWCGAEELRARVERVEAQARLGPRTVSITGGEPLLHAELIEELARALAPRRVHLETAGAHPAALARVLDSVHHVSLDLKLGADLDPPVEAPAALGAGPTPADEDALAAARVACLALVRDRDAAAKLVVSGGTDPALFEPLLDEVAAHAPELPVIVQPATAVRGVRAPAHDEWWAVLERALERGLVARVLPQVHRYLGIP